MRRSLLLRAATVASSLALMCGFVYWRAYAGKPASQPAAPGPVQRPADPLLMSGSKFAIMAEPSASQPTANLPSSMPPPSSLPPGVGGPPPPANPPANPPRQPQVMLPGSKSMVISAEDLIYAPAPNQPAQAAPQNAAPQAPVQQGRAPKSVAPPPRPAVLPPLPPARPKAQQPAKPQLKSF